MKNIIITGVIILQLFVSAVVFAADKTNKMTTCRTKLFISVGSTNPDPLSEAFEAGVVAVDPLTPPIDFHYMW